MSGDRQRKRKAKRVQGYDPSTPRCDTCKHMQRASFGNPRALGWDEGKQRAALTWRPYIPARCLIGDFPVSPMGLCDDWEGHDGSKLERTEE